jgi:hypothetical protein
MLRLALRLALHSGREALVRVSVTAVAVALGVVVLLGVLAEFHAFQRNSGLACWTCTAGTAVSAPLPHNGDLWNASVDFYQGNTISRLDVAALGPNAPVPPGVSRLPSPGQFYASPALAALLRSVPADELGDRFPGTEAGTIGEAALTGPGQLAIYIGYAPAQLATTPGTKLVTSIGTAPAPGVFTAFFRYAFAVGVLAVLFPVLILIGTATRLAAARREERFAALRLAGATMRDIGEFAAVEAAISALFGAILGIVVFLLVRPALAGAALLGTQYFSSTVTPTVWGYVGLLIAVPAASAVVALLSLRRVRISPLGVTRRATPPAPSARTLIPLAVGLVVYVAGLALTTHASIGLPAYPGLLLVMAGLLVGGPWLTAAAARMLARAARGPSPVIASARLEDNPRAAFRAVAGLVLAIFLGTIVGVFVPAADSLASTPSAGALSNVLVDSIGVGPQAGATLIGQLNAIDGAKVYPFYALNGSSPGTTYIHPGGAGPQASSPNAVVSCAALHDLGVLGQCTPGLTAVKVNDTNLTSNDNPSDSTQALANAASPGYSGSLSALDVDAVLVSVNSPATLERVRTYLVTHTALKTFDGPNSTPTPPRTFGETIAIRTSRAAQMQKIVYAAVALTVLVAGCSLAVAVGGGLIDRKRPFTLLRVSGTPVGVLSKVVLLEAAMPLVVVTVVAAIIAYATSVLAVLRLAPAGTAIPQLGGVYYATMGIGVAIALVVIMLTLPILRRMTAPANVRFE